MQQIYLYLKSKVGHDCARVILKNGIYDIRNVKDLKIGKIMTIDTYIYHGFPKIYVVREISKTKKSILCESLKDILKFGIYDFDKIKLKRFYIPSKSHLFSSMIYCKDRNIYRSELLKIRKELI